MTSRKWLIIGFLNLYFATFGLLFWVFTELILPADMVVPWLQIKAPLQDKVDRALMSPDERLRDQEKKIGDLNRDLLSAEKAIRNLEYEKHALAEQNKSVNENYQKYYKHVDQCNADNNVIQGQNRQLKSKITYYETKISELEKKNFIFNNNLLKGKRVLIQFEHKNREKAIGIRNAILENGANLNPCLTLGNEGNMKVNTIYYRNGNDVIIAEEMYKLFRETYGITGTAPFDEKYIFANQFDLILRVHE